MLEVFEAIAYVLMSWFFVEFALLARRFRFHAKMDCLKEYGRAK